jgi:hypothetical protein
VGECGFKNGAVRCQSHADVRNTNDIVTCGAKEPDRNGVIVLIDQHAHLAVCSGRVHFLATCESCRIRDTSAHVLDGKLRVKSLYNLLERHTLLDELEHAVHGNTRPPNACLAEVHGGVDDDTFEHDRSVAPLQVDAKGSGDAFVERLATIFDCRRTRLSREHGRTVSPRDRAR